MIANVTDKMPIDALLYSQIDRPKFPSRRDGVFAIVFPFILTIISTLDFYLKILNSILFNVIICL